MAKKKRKKSYRDNAIARSNEARTVRKVVGIIIISLIIILIVGGISGYTYIKSALEPVDPASEEKIEISIPIGSSTSTIATILEENDVIKDGRVFRFYIKFKNQSDFQAGEYTFTKAFTLDEIIESLKSGKVISEPVYTITIPEGKSIAQMAEIYAKKLGFNEKEFLEKVNDKAYIEELIEKYPTILSDTILDKEIRTPLEGYLFAATYNFYEEEINVETVVESMLDKTEAVIASYQEDIDAQTFTIHELLTFASLLENEARSEDQRKKISGVFYNRMEEGIKLQTDPTVLYALGEHKGKVLLEDLKIESPYNTYHIDSLPIGPISNFGENALEATLHPEEIDMIYFLHDSEGNIYYSKTYEEHLEFKKEHIDSIKE